MEDVKEIQEQEIEALESIYSTEITVICRDYPNIEVEIVIPTDYLQNLKPDEPLNDIILHSIFPSDYPNVMPDIKIIKTNHNEKFLKQLLEDAEVEINNVAKDNLGMPMLFTLVAKLQDILIREIDNYKAKELKLEIEKREIADRLERVQFEGSRVTVEQFNKWQKQFMNEIKAKKEAELKENDLQEGRLTGKQLFLRDNSLNLSDLQFMNPSEQAVNFEIDAALFEDEIGDESFDDEDST